MFCCPRIMHTGYIRIKGIYQLRHRSVRVYTHPDRILYIYNNVPNTRSHNNIYIKYTICIYTYIYIMNIYIYICLCACIIVSVCIRVRTTAISPRRECWLLLRPRPNPSTSFPAAYYYYHLSGAAHDAFLSSLGPSLSRSPRVFAPTLRRRLAVRMDILFRLFPAPVAPPNRAGRYTQHHAAVITPETAFRPQTRAPVLACGSEDGLAVNFPRGRTENGGRELLGPYP